MQTSKRISSLILTIVMAFSVFTGMPLTAVAKSCNHVHGEYCSYAEGAECGHIHDENCGWDKESGTDCVHEHDADCGYIEAVPCDHICDENCGGLLLDSPASGGIIAGFWELEPAVAIQPVEAGAPLESLRLPPALKAYAEDGGDLDIAVESWECETDGGYNADVVGVYSFSPSLALPEDWSLADGLVAPSVTVVTATAEVAPKDNAFYGIMAVTEATVLSEDFEDGAIPTGWSQVQVSGDKYWSVSTGGHSGHPVSAHGGTYNALFRNETNNADVTRLELPSLDLPSGVTTTLTFWHAQEEWSGDQDALRVVYSSDGGQSWTDLAVYENSASGWTKRSIVLPSEAISSDTRLAFEGAAKWGFGICIDDVSVAAAIPDTENAWLSALSYSVDGGDAIPLSGFAPAALTYNVALPSATGGTAAITLNAKPMITGAQVTSPGITLSGGDGTATVTVEVTGSLIKTYTINFTVAPPSFHVIGGSSYATLTEAVAAMPNGGTVEMLSDVSLTSTAKLSVNKTFTLDLKGHTLTNSGNLDSLLYISSGDATLKNGSLINTYEMGIWVVGGTVSLEGLTVRAVRANNINSAALSVSAGTVSILSGDYYGAEDAVYCSDGTVTITSGSFSSTAGVIGDGCMYTENGGKIILAPGSSASIYPWLNNANVLDLTVSNEPATALSVTPSHAVLTGTNDTATFTAILEDASEGHGGNIVWSVTKDGDNDLIEFVDGVTKGAAVTVRAADPAAKGTVLITAIYDGRYTATATVELLPGGIVNDPSDSENNTVTKLLENKVTINTAKTAGALVPVLIAHPEAKTYGIMSSSSIANTGVTLFTQNSKTKKWNVPVTTLTAEIYSKDDRYIEIKQAQGQTAKNAKVHVFVDGIDAGELAITVTEKYPKITLSLSGELNAFYPLNTANIVAKADDGSAVTVKKVEHAVEAKDKLISEIGAGYALTPVKSGTANTLVTLELAGYNSAYKPNAKSNPTGNVVKFAAKVVNTLPKLKLSAASVTLSGSADAAVNLLSADSKKALADYGTVESITEGSVIFPYADGVVTIPGNTAKGSHTLKVKFAGAGEVSLKLTVNVIDTAKVVPSSKTKTVIVNEGHQAGYITAIPIDVNAANVRLSDWEVVSVVDGKTSSALGSSALKDAISATPGENSLTLKVTGSQALKDLVIGGKDRTFTLNIGSPGITSGKTFAVKLTVSAKASAMSISLKNKIDIANPASSVTATVKLTNTTSEIDTVTLYNAVKLNADKTELESDTVSEDFRVAAISGNTFTIMAGNNEVVPAVAQKLSVEIKLKNGECLKSWILSDAAGDMKKLTDKPISITPSQTVGKAYQSKKEVTLYKGTPLTGEGIELNLTTPANVKLGDVIIDPASVKGFEDGGFELVRSGENNWSIRFKNNKLPVLIDSKGTAIKDKKGNPAALKASYTIKLQLWAERTYVPDRNDKPVALPYTDPKSGKTTLKSKPTTVSVKVNIK